MRDRRRDSYKRETEMGGEKGEKEERIYIILEIYGDTGSRTEYMKIPRYL